jgi:hypothetical protein
MEHIVQAYRIQIKMVLLDSIKPDDSPLKAVAFETIKSSVFGASLSYDSNLRKRTPQVMFSKHTKDVW